MIEDMPAAIAEAITKVMGSMKGIEKRGKNEFHRYKFATVGDLMIELQPSLVNAGLSIIQNEEGFHELGGAMVVTYEFILVHSSGAVWKSPIKQTGMATMYNSKGGVDDKCINKCHTAARKYFMIGLFQIPVLEEGDERLSDGDVDSQKENKVIDETELKRRALEKLKEVLNSIDKADLRTAEDTWSKNEGLLRSVPPVALTYMKKIYTARFGEIPPTVEEAA